MNPTEKAQKIADVVSAWQTLRPAKVFAGMTLDEFKLKVKPSVDARNQIDTLENQMIAAQDQRDSADIESLKQVGFVVNAVKGDPAEGEDGELYEAMGYVRKSERKSGLTRKKNGTTPAPTPS